MGDTLEERIRAWAGEMPNSSMDGLFADDVVELLDYRDNLLDNRNARLEEMYNILCDLFCDKDKQEMFDGYFYFKYNLQDLIKVANALGHNDNNKRKINPNNLNSLFVELISGE